MYQELIYSFELYDFFKQLNLKHDKQLIYSFFNLDVVFRGLLSVLSELLKQHKHLIL